MRIPLYLILMFSLFGLSIGTALAVDFTENLIVTRTGSGAAITVGATGAPAIKLQAEILNVYDNNIIINCSVFNGAMDTFVAHIRLLVEGELEKGDAYTIKGSTPDSMDIFRYRVFFDKKPKIGDKVTFLNAGAYNYSSDFCKLPKLETEVVA